MSDTEDQLGPLRTTAPVGIPSRAQSGRDRSTSDAYFPPDAPPSSPLGPPLLLPPVRSETTLAKSIDDVLSTQTEHELAIERQQREALSKRASSVLKLTQEKQDLERELKEMAERLEAIEKRSQQLMAKKDQNSHQQPQPE